MAAQLRHIPSGSYIFKEGEKPAAMYLVKSGTVSVRKMKGQAFVEIARIYSNEIIGELSFFDRQPRSAGAFCMTEVEVMEIDFESLDKIYANVPDYMKSIMAAVADRLRKANDTIKRLQKNTVDDGIPTDQAPGEVSADSDTAAVLAATADVDFTATKKKE